MTMVLQGESQRAAARPLFGAWEETLIESCLDGSMGEVLAGGVAPVRAAVARLGDFAFLAGDAQDPAGGGPGARPARGRGASLLARRAPGRALGRARAPGPSRQVAPRRAVRHEKGPAGL